MIRIAIISFAFSSLSAQPPAYDKWYELTSVSETATGFMFHENRTFEFYYIYGALERSATGNWAAKGDTIVLNNISNPPLDFKLIHAGNKAEGKTTVLVKCPNPVFVSNIYCMFEFKDTVYYAETDQSGIAEVDRKFPLKIELVHGFFPERSSVFTVTGKNNYFEFEIEPWIADVEFRDFILVQEDVNFTGSHPLIDKVNCIYYAPE